MTPVTGSEVTANENDNRLAWTAPTVDFAPAQQAETGVSGGQVDATVGSS